MRPSFSSQCRVSWRTDSPLLTMSICRCISYSMARPSERTLLTFLISQRVPNGVSGRCTLTLASTRIDPSSIFASDAPTARRMARSSVTYCRASSAVRMSGRLTISTSGTPARLKSISEYSLPWIRPPAPP